MENSTEMKNQIHISTLKTAIQKALTKNLPLILNDAVEYLEKYDFEVKQRKRRTKTKSLQNIDDLQKKTQSVSAKKMKTQVYLNLNTNRVNSDSKKIKKKHPALQFGNLKQDDKIVWVCGTPGHLQNTLATLEQSDEKSKPIWEPMSTISESEESDKSEDEAVEEDDDKPVEDDDEPVEDEKWESKNFDDLSDKEDDNLIEEITNMLNLPENEVDPKTSTLGSSEIILQGDPPKKPKKLKRRKKNKPSGSLNGRSRLWKPQKPQRLTKAGKTDSIYTNFEQRGTIF